ncbi:MAG: TetR/AcrR family transcriptional regulator [Paludibacteraceae bacterium]|nr:TetR/AcrR family transcriptional regulator [Paludibacteraceae bacterium]
MAGAELSKEEMIRAEIITAAQKLFQHYGLAKTTMEDIAKAMGRGKSTLYYYYKSKDEIFEAVILKEGREVFDTVFEVIKKASSAEEKLRLFFDTTFNTVKAKMNLYTIMREDLIKSEYSSFAQPVAMRNSIKKFNEKEREGVKDILLTGIESGEFISDIKESVDLFAYVIITSFRGIMTDIAFNENEINATFFDDDKANALVNIFLRGLKK